VIRDDGAQDHCFHERDQNEDGATQATPEHERGERSQDDNFKKKEEKQIRLCMTGIGRE
jgi:hypothetical protein